MTAQATLLEQALMGIRMTKQTLETYIMVIMVVTISTMNVMAGTIKDRLVVNRP